MLLMTRWSAFTFNVTRRWPPGSSTAVLGSDLGGTTSAIIAQAPIGKQYCADHLDERTAEDSE